MSSAPRRLGKYELLQHLGRGNVGEVWKGRDMAQHRDVAIKILHSDLQADPHFMSRFTDEGKVLASLRHPNLVQVYEATLHRTAESSATLAYIASEYIDGYSLIDYLQATSHRGNFPAIADIVYIFTTIGAAIDYAHQHGIIHGNLKPGNILLNKQNRSQFIAGEPMLSDAGIVQMLGDTISITSPQYISPEQAVGDPITGASDIYALGVILYEICTGVVPFRDESSVAVMMQHINALPTPPALINPNVPPALSEVILRAMAKDPATRFSRASLLATAIVEACSTNPIQPLAQQALAKEENYVQKFYQGPYAEGSMQSILGVPQPAGQLPGYFSGPLHNTAPRQPIALTRPLDKTEAISEPSPAASIPEAREVDADALTRAVPLAAPETPDPALNAAPQAQTQTQKTQTQTGTNSGNTANRLTVPVTSVRAPLPSPLPAPARVQETQSLPVTARLHTPPAVSGRPGAEASAMPAPPQYPGRTSSSFLNFSDSPLYIVVICLLLLLLLVGGAIGANLFLNRGSQATAPGRVFFQDDALGRNDQLRLDIPNIPNPPDGTNYTAWLQDTHNAHVYLGVLSVNGGKVSYIYGGNAKHDNLLSFAQGILITVENVGDPPQKPGNRIVYQAKFDEALIANLRNLLYSTPGLPEKQAVTSNLFETIKSINDKAVSIVDSIQSTHDVGLAQRQATRIIELIDGSAYAASSGDRPANMPGLINAPIGLISSPGHKGYIDLLDEQLDAVKASAGNDNPELLRHLENAKSAVVDLRDWVQKMRSYDVQILRAANLASPTITAIALQLKQEAANSYTGRVIPPDSGPKPTLGSAGAYQAYTETQYMATLDLKTA